MSGQGTIEANMFVDVLSFSLKDRHTQSVTRWNGSLISGVVNYLWRNFVVHLFQYFYQKSKPGVKVVIFSTDITHVQQQEQVFLTLKENGLNPQFYTTKYPFIKILRKVDPTASTIYVNPFITDRILIKQTISEFSELKYGVKLSAAEVEYECERIVKLGKSFHYLLSTIRPGIVFVGNDLTMEGRLLVVCCKQLGITTVCISHGLTELNTKLPKTLVDYYFCWGKKEFLRFVNEGKQDARAIISGSPFLEMKLKNKDYYFDSRLQNVVEGFFKGPRILIAFSGPGHITSEVHHKKIINCIRLVVRKKQNVGFIVKLHAKDSMNNYRELLKEPNVRVFAKGDQNLNYQIDKWISYTDILITGSSASSIDAMLREKPVLTVDLMNEYSELEFIREGITLHCTSFEELDTNISSLLSDSAFREERIRLQTKYVCDFFHRGEDSPSQIILNTIRKHLT